jgi:ribosomal protein S18 acetylase RimI-like enzyme
MLWGMYIKPEYRGKNVADNLLKFVILFAKTKVMQLHLTCVASNDRAVKFYQRNGFEIYGTEPRALKIDKQYYDELLMILMFS